MIKPILYKDKQAISNMVSYVLLIIITLSSAAAVYTFLKFQAQIPDDSGACPEDISLIIKNYNCQPGSSIINIDLQNRGLFSIDGFFIKGSNDPDKVPIVLLKRIDKSSAIKGRYDFEPKLVPGESKTVGFSYSEAIMQAGDTLARIEIQPFVVKQGQVATCEDTVSLKTDPAKCGTTLFSEEETPPEEAVCGDDICSGDETEITCPDDCVTEPECTDTCASLGYECGTATVCGETVTCPNTCELPTPTCTNNQCEAISIPTTGLQIHLKVDAITGLSSGQSVTTWQDSSPNNNNATCTNCPAYITNVFNSDKDVVRFNGAGNLMTFTPITDTRTMFVVFNDMGSNNYAHLMGGLTGTKFTWHGGTGGPVIDPVQHSHSSVRGGQAWINGESKTLDQITKTTTHQILSFITSGDVTTDGVAEYQAGVSPSRYWKGNFAEIIIYNTPLSTSDRQTVECYLSAKYGISVPQNCAAI